MPILPALPATPPALAASLPAAPAVCAYFPRGDGTITRFRADASAGKLTLLDTIQTGFNRQPVLVLSADRRVLYAYPVFETYFDGTKEKNAVAAATLTPILVYAIERNGLLHLLQRASVPSPIGAILPSPSGRFLYAPMVGGTFLIRTASDGRLSYHRRLDIRSALRYGEASGEINTGDLSVSPDGRYLYDFSHIGFMDSSSASLQRYRVNTHSGEAKPDGEAWEHGDDVKGDPGAVVGFVSHTAFIGDFRGMWVCPVDRAGRIQSAGAHRLAAGNESGILLLAKHPALPLVVYRSGDAMYEIYRVTAPGTVAKVGAFRSAFAGETGSDIAFDQAGDFLCETATPQYSEGVPWGTQVARVAVWVFGSGGARLCVPPTTLLSGDGRNLLTVSVPGR